MQVLTCFARPCLLAMYCGIQLHRAGAVERDQRDDVVESGGLQLGADALHAFRLELKDADRLAAPEHLIGPRVVEGNRRKIELRIDGPANLTQRRSPSR